jgi:predicted DNA-binding transcriptional regulator YafY
MRRKPLRVDEAPTPPARTPLPRLPEVARPTVIAKDPRAIRSLLAAACEEYWVVRLSYVNGAGRSTELSVEPIELDGGTLYAACFPRGDERALVLDLIDWARVLTEAEEELLP